MARTFWNPWFRRLKTKKGGHLAGRGPTESARHWAAVLPSWIIFEGQVLPFALNVFPKWKKFKELTATVEWPPQLSFFLPLSFQYRRAVIIMYVSAAWVPRLIIFLSVKSSSPSVPCRVPDTGHKYIFMQYMIGKANLSVRQGPAQVVFPLSGW